MPRRVTLAGQLLALQLLIVLVVLVGVDRGLARPVRRDDLGGPRAGAR